MLNIYQEKKGIAFMWETEEQNVIQQLKAEVRNTNTIVSSC